MSGIVIGAAIVTFTALKAGPALWALTGRAPEPVLRIVWPLCLWLLALVLLFALVPDSPLLEDRATDTVLMAACVAVTLVCSSPLLDYGRKLWRARTQSSSPKA